MIRILSLLLLLATAASLSSPVPACCPHDWDCCAHDANAELPARADDCCSIASLNEYFAVSAPLVPQVAPATIPALSTVVDVFAVASPGVAAPSRATLPLPQDRLEILRN